MNLFKTKNKKYVLAIIDDRTGNRNQILAVLEGLNLPYKILDIDSSATEQEIKGDLEYGTGILRYITKAPPPDNQDEEDFDENHYFNRVQRSSTTVLFLEFNENVMMSVIDSQGS